MFIDASKLFLKKPDKKFFEIQLFDVENEITNSLKELKLTKNKVNIARLEIEVTDGSKDVVGTKALKAYEMILEHMNEYGFKILKSGWNFNFEEKLAQAYIMTDANISKDIIQEGPPVKSSPNLKVFTEKHATLKHKMVYKNERVYALIPREFIEPKAFIENMSKKDFIAKRVKRIFVRWRNH